MLFVKTTAAYFTGSSAALPASGLFATWYVGTNQLKFADFTISQATSFTKPIDPSTCQLTAPTVPLGSNPASTFKSIGDRGKASSFNLNVMCPAGVSSIKVSFAPVTAATGPAGSFAADASSTSKGIGIAMMFSDASPVTFNQQYAFAVTNTGSATVATKTFTAAPIKVSDPVSAGMFTGAVVVTLFVS